MPKCLGCETLIQMVQERDLRIAALETSVDLLTAEATERQKELGIRWGIIVTLGNDITQRNIWLSDARAKIVELQKSNDSV